MKNLNKLKKINWELVVSFRTELLTEHLIQSNHHKMAKIIGLPFFKRMIVDNDIYNEREELEKVESFIRKNLDKISAKIFLKIRKRSDLLLDCSKKICSLDLSKLSNKNLLVNLKKWLKHYEETVSLIGAPARLDEVLEDEVRSNLENYDIKDREKIFRAIAQADKPSGNFQEKVDLMKLALEIKDIKEKKAKQIIKKHIDKYSWINLTLLLGDLYSKKEVLARIKKIKQNRKLKLKIKEFNDSIKQRQQEFNSIKKKYKFKPNLLKKIKILKYAVWFRTARLGWLNQSSARVKPLFTEVGKRIGLSCEELAYCFPDEIFKALGSKTEITNKKTIQERIKKYAMYTLNGKDTNLIVGQKVEQLKKLLSQIIKKQKEIKGIIAYAGLIKGRIKILKDRSEFYKIKKGDILVTKLTTPDFVSVMEKSSAIITDLGGITSHAAIVSRELGKPCIVGTKIATKVLKDGDLVEVDAEKGIVKILKGK